MSAGFWCNFECPADLFDPTVVFRSSCIVLWVPIYLRGIRCIINYYVCVKHFHVLCWWRLNGDFVWFFHCLIVGAGLVVWMSFSFFFHFFPPFVITLVYMRLLITSSIIHRHWCVVVTTHHRIASAERGIWCTVKVQLDFCLTHSLPTV